MGDRRILAWLAALVLMVGVGCDNSNSPDLPGGGGGGDDPGGSGEIPVEGRVTGFVMMPDGTPIEGVQVDVIGVETVETDDTGYYVVTGVTPGDIRLKFTKRGYSSNTRAVTVTGFETRSINARLLPVDAMENVRAVDGGVIETEEFRIQFPAGAFVDRNGVPVSGDVEVAITHIDPSTDDILAAPNNDFTAITENGGYSGLMSYAMVDVSLTLGDEEVEIADGMMAGVELVLPTDLPELQTIEPGDQIPTWHFDEELVIWVQEDLATVVESTTEPGRLAAVLDADKFSAWNVDDCFIDPNDPVATAACLQTPVTCIVGNIDDVGENPVVGADVIAGNQNLWGSVSDTTDETGQYLLWPIQIGVTVDVIASATVGGRMHQVTDGSFVVNGPQADGTDPSQCVQIPDIELPTCVIGGVVDVDRTRTHIPGVNVDPADGLNGKAYFFEPDGTPETCPNIQPTMIPVDTCTEIDQQTVDDGLMDFFWGQQPLDAGMDIEVTDGNDTLFLDFEERIVDDAFYQGVVVADDVTMPYDQSLDVRAVGTYGGLPPWDAPASLPLGQEMLLDEQFTQAMFDLRKGEGLRVTTNTQDDSWGTIAMLLPEDGQKGCMCRFNDDGEIDIPADATQDIGTGNAALIITRVTTNMEQLENGYWSRNIGRSTTMTFGEVRP